MSANPVTFCYRKPRTLNMSKNEEPLVVLNNLLNTTWMRVMKIMMMTMMSDDVESLMV